MRRCHKEEIWDPNYPGPTPIARRYVSYVVGFGVALGIGLAPFLGKVAGVDALLNLFPRSLHGSLIPLSAFLMGFIAGDENGVSAAMLLEAVRRRSRLNRAPTPK